MPGLNVRFLAADGTTEGWWRSQFEETIGEYPLLKWNSVTYKYIETVRQPGPGVITHLFLVYQVVKLVVVHDLVSIFPDPDPEP